MTSQGIRIRNIRRLLGLSQEDFGAKIHVSKQYISNLEADRNILNNEKLVSLLVDLNVNINYVLNNIGEPFLNTTQNLNLRTELLKEIEQLLKKNGI